ncbi:HTR6 [Branchiostoma lanceolatum]|uniref:HTR6 protein n=1 Tax=Branchiostoma lanceolatum TaxID=7740 RepID=A0A8J9W4H7_BRALA|nr:HTR6 [Branchiostoma lanceolatum]
MEANGTEAPSNSSGDAGWNGLDDPEATLWGTVALVVLLSIIVAITVEEQTALKDLATNQDIVILPADKGRCTVVLDREQYDRKIQDLLGDKDTYKPLKRDPTTKFKREIIEALKKLETDEALDHVTYLKIKPKSEQPPAFYGLPKIHKQDVPLRPIVSGIGSVTYGVASFLAKILGPLVGKSKHHVQNSADFVNKIKDIQLDEDDIITSYDVCSLFTCIPPKEAVSVVREALEADNTLADRTKLSVDQICKLLDLCLGCTYFTYKGQFFQQLHGCAMGSPVSPIVVNLYMEKFENKALSTFKDTPPANWFRYVDDTWCRLKKRVADDFFEHINQIDDNIKFTQESNNIITSDTAKTDEHRHLRGALGKCGYQRWTFNKALKPSDQSKKTPKCTPLTNRNKANITIPYVQGVSEKLRRIFQNFNIATNFKPQSTLRQRLVHPKDRPRKGSKADVIYRLKCEEPNCNNTYIGETSRSLNERWVKVCSCASGVVGFGAFKERSTILLQLALSSAELLSSAALIASARLTLVGNVLVLLAVMTYRCLQIVQTLSLMRFFILFLVSFIQVGNILVLLAVATHRGLQTLSLMRLFILCLVSLLQVGNILVLLAVATHRSLQTLSNVFLVSLCVSDLLVGALVMPPAVAITLYGEWIFSPGFCAVWVSFDVMLCSASILNLCVISLDRYIQITRPLQHDVYMTNTRAGILIALAWLLAILYLVYIQITRPLQHDVYMTNTRAGVLIALAWLLAILYLVYIQITRPLQHDVYMTNTRAGILIALAWLLAIFASFPPITLGWHEHTGHPSLSDLTAFTPRPQCLFDPSKTYALTASIVTFYIPLAAILFTYSRIYKEAKSQATRVASLNKQFRSESRRRNGKRGSQPSGPSSAKAIRTLGVILGAFMLTWLPFFVGNIVRPFCGCIPGEVFEGLTWLGWCNSTMNPVIYPLFIKDFKQVFRKYLPCCRRRAPPGNAVNVGEMPGAFPLPGPSTSNENGTIEISTVTGNIPVNNPVDAQVEKQI